MNGSEDIKNVDDFADAENSVEPVNADNPIRNEESLRMEEQYLRGQGLNHAIQLEEKYRGLTEDAATVQKRVLDNAEAFKNYIKG